MSIKDIDMINDKVKKEIIKYAVKGKVKLIGSNSIRGLLFTNDIDIETDLQGSPTAIANYFKKSFKFINFELEKWGIGTLNR